METKVKKGPSIKKPGNKWMPKKWRPEYEVIVSLSASGMSHQAVADKFYELSGTRYTVQHISNIVNTPEAKILQEHIVGTIRAGYKESFEEKMARIQHKALDRIEQLLNSDEKFENSPFAVVDRGMRLLKDTGKTEVEKSQNSGINVEKGVFVLTEDAARIMREGTDKANEVKRLYNQ